MRTHHHSLTASWTDSESRHMPAQSKCPAQNRILGKNLVEIACRKKRCKRCLSFCQWCSKTSLLAIDLGSFPKCYQQISSNLDQAWLDENDYASRQKGCWYTADLRPQRSCLNPAHTNCCCWHSWHLRSHIKNYWVHAIGSRGVFQKCQTQNELPLAWNLPPTEQVDSQHSQSRIRCGRLSDQPFVCESTWVVLTCYFTEFAKVDFRIRLSWSNSDEICLVPMVSNQNAIPLSSERQGIPNFPVTEIYCSVFQIRQHRTSDWKQSKLPGFNTHRHTYRSKVGKRVHQNAQEEEIPVGYVVKALDYQRKEAQECQHSDCPRDLH